MRRQELNVFRMRLMGAKVVGVSSGTRTLKDATTEAIRDWVTNVNDTYYIIGSVVGPAPYPRMVRDFQSVIGREARAQTVAVATPCCPAPVSAMMRRLPMRRASSACPTVLLILCAPVWFRSSRLSHTVAPTCSEKRGASVNADGRPT